MNFINIMVTDGLNEKHREEIVVNLDQITFIHLDTGILELTTKTLLHVAKPSIPTILERLQKEGCYQKWSM